VWSAELQLSVLKQLKLFYSKHTDYLTVGLELKVGARMGKIHHIDVINLPTSIGYRSN